MGYDMIKLHPEDADQNDLVVEGWETMPFDLFADQHATPVPPPSASLKYEGLKQQQFDEFGYYDTGSLKRRPSVAYFNEDEPALKRARYEPAEEVFSPANDRPHASLFS